VSLSVITVIHNSAEIVGEFIASLPADMEMICVDNASSDCIPAALTDSCRTTGISVTEPRAIAVP
jgi:hypothetical protein